MTESRLDLPPGILDLPILETFSPGPLHGWTRQLPTEQVVRVKLTAPAAQVLWAVPEMRFA
jgi:hypothetical protein